jgi:hypothetical protein
MRWRIKSIEIFFVFFITGDKERDKKRENIYYDMGVKIETMLKG